MTRKLQLGEGVVRVWCAGGEQTEAQVMQRRPTTGRRKGRGID